MAEKEWVLVRDTMLATEVSLKRAGKLFKKAGFAKKKEYDPDFGNAPARVEVRAEYITLTEILGMIEFKKAGAIVPAPESGMSSVVKKAIQSDDIHQQLIETCEEQDKVINELRDEVRQLRQHIAQLQHRNGLGDRAKKALSTARQTLSLIKGD